MEGVVCPITGPVKGLTSRHFVEGSFLQELKLYTTPVILIFLWRRKRYCIPLIKLKNKIGRGR
jgi:hypothetical protein